MTTQTEHKCVLDSCRQLEAEGFELTYLPVQKDGLVDLEQLESAIKPTTTLVSVMTVSFACISFRLRAIKCACFLMMIGFFRVVLASHSPVLDGFHRHFQVCVHFPLTENNFFCEARALNTRLLGEKQGCYLRAFKD